jgi:hypothetical protein
MGPPAIAVLLTATAALAPGEEVDTGAAPPKTDIRKEILAPYRFVPHDAAPELPAPFLAPPAPASGNQRLSMPAPSEFREPRMLNQLDAAILREQAGARDARMASRLGIGASTVRVGKHVVLGAATAFYVPVGVGLGIVW